MRCLIIALLMTTVSPALASETPVEHARTFLTLNSSEWTAIITAGLAVLAFFALIYTVIQVHITRRQSRGHFLFELEARWRSDQLRGGQREVGDLINTVSKHVKKRYWHFDERAQQQEAKQLYFQLLRRMRRYNMDRYRKINSLFEFFETIGVIVDRKALDLDTVMQLFAGVFEKMDEVFRSHIEEIRQPDPGRYKHTVQLFAKSKTWLAKERAKLEKKERRSRRS